MSNTSNFDFCVQLGLVSLKAIFHLALKNEAIFPHNLPPIPIMLGAHAATVSVRLLDDQTDPADLALEDEKHLRFGLPVEMTIEIPTAPDPALARITLKSTIAVPGRLSSWPVDGEGQLGIDFADVTPAVIDVPALTGLPVLDSQRFESAIHSRFETLTQHSWTEFGNTLNIYDGTRGPPLTPPNKPGNPEIEAALESHAGVDYLAITIPIHATVTNPINWARYGSAVFRREMVSGDGTVSVLMDQEPDPDDPVLKDELATTVTFDDGGFIGDQVAAQVKPRLIAALAGFGPITEPWFTEPEAKVLIQEQTAAYIQPRKFPFYTPRSGDPDQPLSTPVGFLLPATDTLAILMNRRSGGEDADQAPDTFRGDHELALAIGRAKLDEVIAAAISTKFPGLSSGGAEVSTDEGSATLQALSVTPSDPGAHDIGEGHLWVDGEAEVHIDCWFDPDVTFEGAIFLRLDVVETETECSGTFRAEMGEFDASESCCDVFIDIIIPVVGLIMLAVVENMIDDVGGELAEEFAEEQTRQMQPIPPFVAGVAELQACLEGCNTSAQGLVLPGKLRIRREGTSFEDLAESRDLPRP